jgi:hypothetical protein
VRAAVALVAANLTTAEGDERTHQAARLTELAAEARERAMKGLG